MPWRSEPLHERSVSIGRDGSAGPGLAYVVTIPLYAHAGAPPSGAEPWLKHLAEVQDNEQKRECCRQQHRVSVDNFQREVERQGDRHIEEVRQRTEIKDRPPLRRPPGRSPGQITPRSSL